MSYMGLDIGQTGCKAVIFDENGKQLSSSYRECKTVTPREGWAELDSKNVRDSCFAVMKEAQSQCSKNPVRSMGISSQGEAFTPIGSGGELLGNAMITFDTRASEIADSWKRKFGIKKLYNLTGHTAHPMFSLFKLLWLRENKKEIFKRTVKFLCFEDLLQYCLGLEPHISWCLAGRTMFFNLFKHDWEEEILNEVGIDRSNLAIPVPSGTLVGTVSKTISKELGFSDKVKVVASGHDQPLGALGAGVISSGKAMYATGTSECIAPSFSRLILNEDLFKNNLCTYDHVVKGLYITLAFSLTGGNLLKWFRDEWGQIETQKAAQTGTNAYEHLLQKIGNKPSKLMVLPYFTPTGTPYYDAEVSGAVLGLRLSTKREEVLRALLEGVAFEMRLNLEILEDSGIPINELRAIGGGAKSRIWLQLKADILNKSITTVSVTEAACFGAAMLACSSVTGEPIESLVPRWVKTEAAINPHSENAEFYTDRFVTYKKLYPTLKTLQI